MEEGRARLGRDGRRRRATVMSLAPAITDIEQVKNHPAVAGLLGWKEAAVQGVKFDRDEMTIYVDASELREACVRLTEDPSCRFNFMSVVTCVDWYTTEAI